MLPTTLGELGEPREMRRDGGQIEEYLLELLEVLRREIVRRSGRVDVDVTIGIVLIVLIFVHDASVSAVAVGIAVAVTDADADSDALADVPRT